jgi:hypothetical protein
MRGQPDQGDMLSSPQTARMLVNDAPSAVESFFNQPASIPSPQPSEEEEFFAQDGSWA